MILALLPAVPVVGFFASYARYLAEEKDEYQRTLVVRQILGATTVAMACAVVWGFLTDLGGAPPIATYWIAFVWVSAQGVMALLDWRRGA
jgi:O-antigen/teichoic acid export membrane protein